METPLAPPLAYATDTAARWKIALVVTKSVGSAILGVLMGSDWLEMTRQQQFMAVIAIVVNVCVSLEALYDRTMSSRAAGKAATGATPSPFGAHTPIKP
jgi:hypothetical protein